MKLYSDNGRSKVQTLNRLCLFFPSFSQLNYMDELKACFSDDLKTVLICSRQNIFYIIFFFSHSLGDFPLEGKYVCFHLSEKKIKRQFLCAKFINDMMLAKLSKLYISNVIFPNKYTYTHKTHTQTYICIYTETTADCQTHTYTVALNRGL